MKIEQKIVLIYTLLAISSSFATHHFFGIGDIFLAISLPLIVYAISLLLIFFWHKTKKILIFYNSFVTFFLIWVVLWILLYNLY